MSLKHMIRKIFRNFGYDILKFAPASHPLSRLKLVIEHYQIDMVIDVGANIGQFALMIRGDLGYKNRIVSFEPLSAAFEILKNNSKHISNWRIYNYALGDTNCESEVNIAGNSFSSSMLDMLPRHISSAPESKYIGKERVTVKTLDSIYDSICKSAVSIFLKIDTQGFEQQVLKGAELSLQYIDTIQLEMSLVPLYKGELLLIDMCALLKEKGYDLISLESGFTDIVSGRLLQVNGLFHRFSKA